MITKTLKVFLFIAGFLLFVKGCDVVDSVTGGDSNSNGVELYPVELDGEWGYINKNGRIVIEPDFNVARPFSDGVAVVRDGGTWKVIDSDGKELIEGDFNNIRSFSEGLAAAQLDGRWGFINKDGRFVINPKFRDAFPFSDGRAFVRSLDFRDYFYIDKDGEEIQSTSSPEEFNFVEENMFSGGRALIRDNDLFGYINTNAEMVIDLRYPEALPFSENLAAVRISDRWGFIDKNGNVEISPQFISAGSFNNGLAPARISSNSFGYIDKNGSMVIPEQFEIAQPFSENRAAVFADGKWFYIDRSGNPISNLKFDEAEPFQKGLARVTTFQFEVDDIIEFTGYIDKNGSYVWFPTN